MRSSRRWRYRRAESVLSLRFAMREESDGGEALVEEGAEEGGWGAWDWEGAGAARFSMREESDAGEALVELLAEERRGAGGWA